MKNKKFRVPKRYIRIENLACMPYDKHGMHATGRRIYAFNTLIGYMFGWDEYADSDGVLHYYN